MKAQGGGGRRSPPKLRGSGGGPTSSAGKDSRPAGCDNGPSGGLQSRLGSVVHDHRPNLGEACMEDAGEDFNHGVLALSAVNAIVSEDCMEKFLHERDALTAGESSTAMDEGPSSSINEANVNNNSGCLGMDASLMGSADEGFCMGAHEATGSIAIQRSSTVRPNVPLTFSASKNSPNPPGGSVAGLGNAFPAFDQGINGGNPKVQPIFGTFTGQPMPRDHQSHPAWRRPALVPLLVAQNHADSAATDGPVKLDVEAVNVTIKKFDSALVGRLFGHRLPFNYLNAELHRQWQGFGSFRLVTISGDCFICFFDNIKARNAVLLGGPWVVAGQVVRVDYRSPNFSPMSSTGFITPVWVRLPNLPLYCWDETNIGLIANRLGIPIWMDSATDRMERGYFARVCVRIDLTKPLKPRLWVEGPFGSFFQKVEYEGLFLFCFQCGHVGHKSASCGTSRTTLNQKFTPGSSAGRVVDEVSLKQPGDSSSQPTGDIYGSTNVLHHKDDNGAASSQRVDQQVEANVNPEFGPWMLVVREKCPPRMSHPRSNGKLHSNLLNAPAASHGHMHAPPPHGISTPGGSPLACSNTS